MWAMLSESLSLGIAMSDRSKLARETVRLPGPAQQSASATIVSAASALH